MNYDLFLESSDKKDNQEINTEITKPNNAEMTPTKYIIDGKRTINLH